VPTRYRLSEKQPPRGSASRKGGKSCDANRSTATWSGRPYRLAQLPAVDRVSGWGCLLSRRYRKHPSAYPRAGRCP